ncbi:class I SAM-dependent methyltransferase [Bradyrhizobium lablabi]|uniref:class I SAM-dependent methyltransferase n=1 Tax=Bradyrhizobium lablabi TaxID=722472 RepID=UPI001BAD7C12|nr:class I SAM-dependent methyltransferase [Bradyrhizobium lablabi]MBR0697782.1 class I SAM-dependent methyltransferase [Bradyrhizobium lablabi]
MLNQLPQAVFVERTHCINCGSPDVIELSSGHYTDQPLHGFLAADPWGEDPLPYLQSATWSLAKCATCSQVFHRRILNEEWNERRFTMWMNAQSIVEFEKRRGAAFPRAFAAATGHLEHILRIEEMTKGVRPNDQPVRLLDFGCGFGSFIETCVNFGFQAEGIDRSIGRRSEAKVHITPTLDKIDGRFHAVTLFEVLEHLDDPSGVLEALSTRIVPGGILVLETPDCTGVTNIETHRDYLLVHPLEHINCFTNQTLISIAKRTGFEHIARAPAFALANSMRATKRLAKYALRQDGRSTQLYFRKS